MLNKLKFIVGAVSVMLLPASVYASGDVVSGVMGIYHHAIKPIPHWVSKAAKGANDKRILFEAKLDKDGRAIGTAFYTAGGKVMTKAVDPAAKAAVRSTVAVLKIPTYDIVYRGVLVPAKNSAVATWNGDVRDGVLAIGSSEKSAGSNLAKDLGADKKTLDKDATATYDATAVPFYQGAKAATISVYHGTIKVLCGDQGCSADPGNPGE